jgi:hypothetical protein
MKDTAGILALLAVIGAVAYLLYRAANKSSAQSSSSPLFDFGGLLSNIGAGTQDLENLFPSPNAIGIDTGTMSTSDMSNMGA